MRAVPHGSDGCLAALPMAGGLTLLLARALPIRFDYHPNDLGIVSLAARERYPLQQETFWLVFALGVGTLLAWLLARRLRQSGVALWRVVALEALGALALCALLWLPAVAASLLCVAAAGGALALASRAPTGEAKEAAQPTAPPARPLWRTIAWIGFAATLPWLLLPTLWINAWDVAHAVPDAQRVRDLFRFHGETGQHLAWANALRNGGFHGRDFFCLYGPFYDLGVVGFWGLFGRSIAAWGLYESVTRAVGWTAALLLAGMLVRRRVFALLIIFLCPAVSFRLGLPLLGMLCLTLWLRGTRGPWALLAGLVAGCSVLYSQEYGFALLVAAALALVVKNEARPAAVFATGLAAIAIPLLGWYAAHDALAPMLRDVVDYPRYMLAGYGKLPFPAILPGLPWDPAERAFSPGLDLRLGYALPAVFLAAVLLAIPISALDGRRPLASLGAIRRTLAGDPLRLSVALLGVFGLVAFRSCLGRSDLNHILLVLPAGALLVAVAVDRLFDAARREPRARALVLWRALALAFFVGQSGFADTAAPLAKTRETLSTASSLLRDGRRSIGSARVNRVVSWIERHAGPDDPILFLPDNASYYYLTDRPSPIRFVLGHQIVTDAHRAEALADLRANPPRFVVWDHDSPRVDGTPDELVFGAELLGWIEREYEEHERIGDVKGLGGVEIRKRRGSAAVSEP